MLKKVWGTVGMRRWAVSPAILLLMSGTASASIDYTCLNRCTAQNYQYAYCQEVCSYGAAGPRQPQVWQLPTVGRDLPNLMMQMEAMRLQREQLQMQQEQAAAQRRLLEQQAQTQALENQRREQELRATSGGGSVPVPDPAAVAMFERWLGAVAPRMSRYPDFMSVATAADVMITPEMAQFITSSPFAADISYYLGTHKDEAARIAGMSVLDQAVAIKEIERRNQSEWSK